MKFHFVAVTATLPSWLAARIALRIPKLETIFSGSAVLGPEILSAPFQTLRATDVVPCRKAKSGDKAITFS
jgi:hypothetical protein